ncbi:hypothetical protein UFOVP1082_50 [uncultured Caudovirales phage]|uniref:Uncharacterized protein n=1 Tax=uncultured Caudovirales phage TaxID=2100421 RepID=A0A6J5PFU8_9CAUD|nr:hypothetical protein UFOVP906_28 [uncultured Caudovirales phage]CAB4176703.1 hypothetical protein UFOVP992_54 [uncultured Caudovirales phage]CAB4183448.1 hypothetical protein UFOVP1082_50 [uncultured Caudovirales phage]CAB4197676.1 hypothetical protein UFOVP1322_35 [uncultured Caudovirales phage]CAB4212994.1 hypothetical protein UFOVP1434_57 [uncultured Caudovirales phage]
MFGNHSFSEYPFSATALGQGTSPIHVRSFDEFLLFIDGLDSDVIYVKSLDESIDTNDFYFINTSLTKTIDEFIDYFDESILNKKLTLSIDEQLNVLDEGLPSAIRVQFFSDAILTADAFSLYNVRNSFIEEGILFNDQLFQYIKLNRLSQDELFIIDAANKTATFNFNLLDSLIIDEDFEALFISYASSLYDVRIRISAADGFSLGNDTFIRANVEMPILLSNDKELFLSYSQDLNIGGH